MKNIIAIFLAIIVLGAGCSVSLNTDATSRTEAVKGTPIATKPTEVKPTSGTVLDLSGKGLTSIPMDVFSRTDLTELNLSNNNLTGAPQSQIGQLKNLKVLNLSNNALTGLPAELGQLKKLETLDVSNNNLTGLPNELGNLTQLRVFILTGNAYSTQDLDGIAAKLINTEIRR